MIFFLQNVFEPSEFWVNVFTFVYLYVKLDLREARQFELEGEKGEGRKLISIHVP